MTDSWHQAITYAEQALRGDAEARLRVPAAIGVLRSGPLPVTRATLGRDLAYLTTLLDTLGLREHSRELLENLVPRLLLAPESLTLPSSVRNELAVTLTDRGQLPSAAALLSAGVVFGVEGGTDLDAARTLANLAAVKLRLGDHAGAATAAEQARRWTAPGGPLEEHLDIRLLSEAVLVDATRQEGRSADADQLLDALADSARGLVRLLGGDHPKSLSALVTLASAEFDSARDAANRERMERAADVLAIAAQKASATLGPRHPLSRSAVMSLATTEFEAARTSGDERRLEDAKALIRGVSRHAEPTQWAAAQRTDAQQAGAERSPAARMPKPLPAPVTGAGRPSVHDHPRIPEHRQYEPGAGTDAASLRFTVLGPVQARRDGEVLPSGSPQQRALMAALLLRGGRTATAGELIDALWGDEPPSQALAAIRTYAARLRKTLGPGVLVSESGGYALAVQPGTLDLHEATRLATEADEARSRGDLDRARALITSALDLWDGDPLQGTPGPYAASQRARLEEWRLQLLESRADMNLEHGLHAEAVSELTALTAAHPLRERLRELLMLALYRSGRQAEALAVYAETRRLLSDELGVDPRPELSELQQRILQADEELAAPSPTANEAPPPVFNRPSQLPATVFDFTGRTSLVRELEGVLLRAGRDGMSVAAVSGMGGVGKTTLAVQVAHAVRAHFPDGQLYVDLQGAGPRAAEPETILGAFLRALGQPDSAIPDTLDERAALYRSTLDGRRVLVLLDNARDAAQIRHLLLPTTAGCAALVTSRGRMTDLAGAHLLDLDVLSPEEATLLFTRIVGHERVAAERQAALDVVAACGFLPLAIRIAASRLAARRTWTVSTLAAKLADKLHRLDELRAGDLAVKATFELGYGQLEPAQARAFRLLGLAEGPDIALPAAAALLDLPLQETEDLLEALVDASLLESAAPGRYSYGDLLRLYARACAERDEHPTAERGAALSRLLDFYLATAARGYAIERPGDRFVDHLRPTAHPGLTFDNRDAAQDWLYFEANCLLACARQSTGADSLGRAVDLLWTARDLAESGSNSTQYEDTATALRDAAAACGDIGAERRALAALSNAHLSTGRLAEADLEASSAHFMAAEADDDLVLCWAAATRGVIATYQNRPADAEAHLLEAIELFRADRDGPGEAAALCHLSRVHLLLGRTASAIELAERGADIYETMGYTLQSANARYALGIALSQSGRHSEALAELSDALAIFREDRQRLWEGSTHFRIAEAHLASGRPAQAVQHTHEALALGAIGGDWTRGNVLTVLGRALDALGQTTRALGYWQEALAHFERLRAQEAEAVRGQLEAARTRTWRGA